MLHTKFALLMTAASACFSAVDSKAPLKIQVEGFGNYTTALTH